MPINRTIWRLARLVEWLQKKASTPLRDRFSVGRGTYGEPAVLSWGGPSTLRVGSFCSIAEGVVIFLGGGNHRHDWITTYPFSVFRESAKAIAGQMQTKGDVIIGNDVWIGASAVILSGVSIGDGAVIGAYAVVSKSVPAYTVAVGNPARPVRKRFTEEEIALLQQIAWWDWSDEKLDAAMPILLSGEVSKLASFAASHAEMA